MIDLPIALIAAMDANRVIGKNGVMPWHLPEDLKWFKKNTLGNPVMMGRKTWESLPGPLEGRQNIVLSSDPDYTVPSGIWLFQSASEAETAVNRGFDPKRHRLFIIGGETLFRLYLNRAEYLYLSRIDAVYEGDTHFPPFDPQDWQLIHSNAVVSLSGPRIEFQIWKKSGSLLATLASP